MALEKLRIFFSNSACYAILRDIAEKKDIEKK